MTVPPFTGLISRLYEPLYASGYVGDGRLGFTHLEPKLESASRAPLPFLHRLLRLLLVLLGLFARRLTEFGLVDRNKSRRRDLGE